MNYRFKIRNTDKPFPEQIITERHLEIAFRYMGLLKVFPFEIYLNLINEDKVRRFPLNEAPTIFVTVIPTDDSLPESKPTLQ